MFVDTNRQFKLTSRIWSRSEAPNVEFAPSVFLPELPHVKTHFILIKQISNLLWLRFLRAENLE